MSTKSKTTKSRSRKSSSKREPVHQSHVTNKTHLDTLPIELREKVYDEANEDIKRLLRKDLDSAYVLGLNIFEYDYEKIRKQLGIKRYDSVSKVSKKIEKFRQDYLFPIITYYFAVQEYLESTLKTEYVGQDILDMPLSSIDRYKNKYNKSIMKDLLDDVHDNIMWLNKELTKVERKFNSRISNTYLEELNTNIRKINNTLISNKKDKIPLVKSKKTMSSLSLRSFSRFNTSNRSKYTRKIKSI